MTEELSYQIIGEKDQVLEINLEPNKTLIADGGALLYLDEEISLETRNTDGADEMIAAPELDDLSDDDIPEAHLHPPVEEPEPDLDDYEEPDREESLLEKLWIATRKALSRVGKSNNTNGQNSKEEEDEALPADEWADMPEETDEEEIEEEIPGFITHFHNHSEYRAQNRFYHTQRDSPSQN
ncbi:MAG: AIM24 family protein [Bacteroidia bacterium]|nr:AIM24 family protein [Bacteroidia bacterium]